MINTFQWQICCLNFNFFVICNVKRKGKIRYSIRFWLNKKQPLNKQNSLTLYYFRYLSFLEGFLGHHNDHTNSTFLSIHDQITPKIKI